MISSFFPVTKHRDHTVIKIYALKMNRNTGRDWFIYDLIYWGREKMDAISQTIFPNAFSWMKMYEFRLNCPWSLFLMVQLKIFQHWSWLWLGAVQVPSHYLNQWRLVFQRIYASLGLSELKWTTIAEGVVYLWLNGNKTIENMVLGHIYRVRSRLYFPVLTTTNDIQIEHICSFLAKHD